MDSGSIPLKYLENEVCIEKSITGFFSKSLFFQKALELHKHLKALKAIVACQKISGENQCFVIGLQLYLKKRPWHRCFPVNFANFSRKTLQNTSG